MAIDRWLRPGWKGRSNECHRERGEYETSHFSPLADQPRRTYSAKATLRGQKWDIVPATQKGRAGGPETRRNRYHPAPERTSL